MDVGRLSPSGKALWILVLAGLWLPMVQLDRSRNISLRRRSNPDESQGDVESIKLTASSCSPSRCNHGYCPFRQCSCFPGFTGSNCSQVPSTCSSDLSCNHGYCWLGSCTCFGRMTGSNCTEVATSCSLNTCVHGSCPPVSCVCHDGYTGPACNKVASCNSKTCIIGFCTSDDKCRCSDGYKGPTCNEATSTLNDALLIFLILGLPIGILIIFAVCFFYFCGCPDNTGTETVDDTGTPTIDNTGTPTIDDTGTPTIDTQPTLTTAKVEENVYVDISVISSGSW